MPRVNYKYRNLNEVVTRIKQHIDIIKVMADAGLAVSNSGERTVKIRCFEHQEDTPSLVVSPAKGLFNCFGAGCGAGGDCIAFVQQFHKLGFQDALNFLVGTYSIDVHDLVVEKTDQERALDRFANINYAAARFLFENARQNDRALAVLKSKGISDIVRGEFIVGYASNAHQLCAHLRSKGATQVDLETLQFTRDDIFTNRIIYPLFDLHGRVVSFYGRAVAKAAVKYIGTSRSYKSAKGEIPHPLIESAVPFGLHIARMHVSQAQGQLIMVEGHNDVLGLHSHGIRNVAAMMTAAPSERQYATIHALHINNIVICPDGDEAGFRTIESINKNRSLHQQVKVVTIPDGSDPDEFVKENGPTAFKKLIADAVFPIELIIRDVAEKYNDAGPTAKLDMSAEAMKYMAHLSGFEREFALEELSTITNISKEVIEETVSSMDEGPMADVELERKVIGECINDKARSIHAHTVLESDAFTAAKHSTMWNALKQMVKEDIEPFTREMFITYAIDKEFLTDKEAELVPRIQLGSLHSLDYALSKLSDLALRRRLVKSATRLLVDSKAKKADVREVLTNHMVQLATTASVRREVTTAQQQITPVMDYIHDRMANPGIPGIDIGHHWKKFMFNIMGFQRGHMLAIAGVTKMGKTTIAQNWNIQQLINVGEPALWINLEMKEQDLVMRNLSILSGVDNNRLKIGNISKEEKHAIDRAAATYHGFKLHVANMAGASVFDVVNCMRRYVYTAGVRIVFIDYLQLIRVDRVRGKGQLWEEQNEVVAAIRDAISKLSVTGIVISQLNRGAMADHSSSGQHVSGTIKLIQDADCFMGIRAKRKEELELAPHANSELQIEYNRHGPQGVAIDLQFKYGSMQIREAV